MSLLFSLVVADWQRYFVVITDTKETIVLSVTQVYHIFSGLSIGKLNIFVFFVFFEKIMHIAFEIIKDITTFRFFCRIKTLVYQHKTQFMSKYIKK